MRTLYTNFIDGLSGETRAMLVDGGRVVWNTAETVTAEGAEVVDLGGKTLLPKFIDAHCHILPGGLDLQKLHLGGCTTKEEVLDAVRDWHAANPDGWLMAVHYDQTKFGDGQHLTRAELDPISADRPIILRHSNGHASIANSGALKIANVTKETPDPKGGTFGRDAAGEPNGVLLENAHERVTASAPSPTLEQMVEGILAAGRRMAEFGIGTATDMMTGRYDLPMELQAYRIAAERGNPIRVRLCMQWGTVFKSEVRGQGEGQKSEVRSQKVEGESQKSEVRSQKWEGRERVLRSDYDEITAGLNPETVKIWGVKIFADGAIGSATAAIYGRFMGSALDVSNDGTLMYAPERLREMVRMADAAGFPIAIHTIGDRSTDLVMEAYELLPDARKHRIEHAMILSDAQIERMARLGAHVTMQPEFLHRFGHAYKRQLGPEAASKLERFRSVLDAGISLSFNSDFPIVVGDPWIAIETASNRPEGFDPSENCTRAEAIRAYTVMGAVANHDEGLMGTLSAGELADFQAIQAIQAI